LAEPLSLLVPVYNEADNFRPLVAEIERHVPPPFVVYVVYDFEADTTVPVARELAATRPWLRLLRNDLGRGVVNALRVGFRAVGSGPALVVMADLSDDLSLVPAILELYRAGNLVVCPSRYMRGGSQSGGGVLKSTLSRLAGVSLHVLAGFPTHDATNNYRLYDAALVNEMGIETSGAFEVALELTAKAFRRGVGIAELPASWRDRTAGQSSFRLRALLPRYLRWYSHVLATAWWHRRRGRPVTAG
jgi:dolichol-phosphate mannosyltransferase